MKKSLLFGAMLVAGIAPALAIVDGFTYETKDGFTCQSKWIDDRTSNMHGWNQLPFSGMASKARTACLAQVNGKDYAVIGFSKTMAYQVDGEDKSDDFAHLVFVDFANGAVEKVVQMTCDGKPVQGLLCANQVGCDEFGHIWFAGYVPTAYSTETQKATPLTIYIVDDIEAGTCHKAAELVIADDEAAELNGGRIDYCDIVGDLTLKEAGCTVMCAFANIDAFVGGWTCEQGGTEWTGAMDGYTTLKIADTFPADQTSWGTAPMVRICLNESFTNELYYVDGFTTNPSLYDPTGAMIDSFANAVDLAPKPGTNGVGEFTLNDVPFVAYSMAQYDVDPGCQIRVATFGEGMSYTGMKEMWVLPTNGLGTVSDGGTRIHAVETRVFKDVNGKEGAYLLTYKCNNGLGVYAVAEEGWIDPNGVESILADELDENAPVEYFNLNGVAVDGNNLPAGLYITRQGKTVNKVVVK